MNMKKVFLGLIGILVLSFLFSGIVWFTRGGSFVREDQKKQSFLDVNQEKTMSLNGISQIEIHTVSSNINLVTTSDTEVKASLNGNIKTFNRMFTPELETRVEGNTMYLQVKLQRGNFIGPFSSNIVLNIQIPESYSGSVKVDTTSGDLRFDKLKADSFSFKTVSGDLNADHLDVRNCILKSTSGDVNIDRLKGSLTANSVSGDYIISYEECETPVEMKTTSGDIELKLPQDASFKLFSKTVSGNINCNLPIAIKQSGSRSMEGIVRDGKNEIHLNTVSGDIEIR